MSIEDERNISFKTYTYMTERGPIEMIPDAKLKGDLEACRLFCINPDNFRLIRISKPAPNILQTLIYRLRRAYVILRYGDDD